MRPFRCRFGPTCFQLPNRLEGISRVARSTVVEEHLCLANQTRPLLVSLNESEPLEREPQGRHLSPLTREQQARESVAPECIVRNPKTLLTETRHQQARTEVCEGRGVFSVDIEHDDARVGSAGEALQEGRDEVRLALAGSSEHRKVPSKKAVYSHRERKQPAPRIPAQQNALTVTCFPSKRREHFKVREWEGCSAENRQSPFVRREFKSFIVPGDAADNAATELSKRDCRSGTPHRAP
ncbi:protein of unknown function (plasmid) [Rhodovastum atsumiense]|nr:protein of unknown function [Rhodovastum atsumiense]